MNLEPFGDGRLQVTVVKPEPGEEPIALLTVRCKDQDVTADQLDALSRDAKKAANRLRKYADEA